MSANADVVRDGQQVPLTCLLFELGEAVYAVDALSVIRTFWLPMLDPAEGLPAFVVGVLELHGEVVPIIDLACRLGHPPRPCQVDDCVILLRVGDCLAGVIAEQVLDVEAVQLTRFACDGLLDKTDKAGLRLGEVLSDGRVATLLDHWQLMSVPEDEPPAESCVSLWTEISDVERERLVQRAAELGNEQTLQAFRNGWPLAVVDIGGEWFGLELGNIREFTDVGAVTPVPCCPAHVLGNTSLRGEIVTLIDVRVALHMPAHALSGQTRLVVLEHDGLLLGIPVEQVVDVLEADRESLRPLSVTAARGEEDHLGGELPYRDRIVVVLDLPNVLSSAVLSVNETV